MLSTHLHPEYLTSKEVAKLLRVSRETVQQYTREGRLVGAKIGRQYLYSRKAIDDFLARGRRRP